MPFFILYMLVGYWGVGIVLYQNKIVIHHENFQDSVDSADGKASISKTLPGRSNGLPGGIDIS